MIRRKTNIKTKKTSGGSTTKALRARSTKSASRGHSPASEMRFKISLLILIALLSISAYLFVMVLAWNWPPQTFGYRVAANNYIAQNVTAKKISPANNVINDANLDYKLTVPKDFTGWIYKTGNVKDPVDDTISDQYLKIYLPLSGKMTSANFDSRYADILTILRFPIDTWQKLDKDCQKGNSEKCDTEGTKISQTEDFVFAYQKTTDCPQEIQTRCANVGKIINSFQLK